MYVYIVFTIYWGLISHERQIEIYNVYRTEVKAQQVIERLNANKKENDEDAYYIKQQVL